MKPILIIILGLLLFSSCEDKKDVANQIPKNNIAVANQKLIKQYHILKEKKDSIDAEYRNQELLVDKLSDSLHKNIYTGANIEDSSSFQILTNYTDFSYSTSNKDVFSFIFSYFLLNDDSLMSNISDFNNVWDKDLPSFNEIRHLWINIDRDPETIERLYTDNDKRFIYSLFSQNNYYKTSGLQCIVEGLLLAHKEFEEFDEPEELLDSLYNSAISDQSETAIMIDGIKSEEMKVVLANENYNPQGNSDIYYRMYYVYTFWARRQHEGNSALIFKIMSDFHKSVKNECP